MKSIQTLVFSRLQVRGLRVLVAVVGLALLAQVRIPLPFTPVPVTGQTLGVLLTAALLPPVEAVTATILYVLAGSLGLPVFAGFGHGWTYLLGPTGGYLLGFIGAAWVISTSLATWAASPAWRRWPALLLGNLTIYLFGLPWLAVFVGWKHVLALGLIPFIPGDLLKLFLAGMLVPRLRGRIPT